MSETGIYGAWVMRCLESGHAFIWPLIHSWQRGMQDNIKERTWEPSWNGRNERDAKNGCDIYTSSSSIWSNSMRDYAQDKIAYQNNKMIILRFSEILWWFYHNLTIKVTVLLLLGRATLPWCVYTVCSCFISSATSQFMKP